MSDKKRTRLHGAVVNINAMDPDMAERVVSISTKALRDGNSEREMAAEIRAGVTELYPANTWHCFVGRKFSSFVTYEAGKYIYFYIGQMGVVVFAS